MRLGISNSIGPCLLPERVKQLIELSPQKPLLLQDKLTVKWLMVRRSGEFDCAIMAEPYPDFDLAVAGAALRRSFQGGGGAECPLR